MTPCAIEPPPPVATSATAATPGISCTCGLALLTSVFPFELTSLATPGALLVEFFFVGIVFGLLGVWLKGREVADRIASLTANIEAIKAGGNPVSRFAGEINPILDELEYSRQELKGSENRCRLLFENSNDLLLVCEMGEEGMPCRILDANAAACRCLGYTREKLFNLTPESVILIENGDRGDKHHPYSIDLITWDGERISAWAGAHHTRPGETPTLLIIARDMTEQQRVEEEFADQRSRLENQVARQADELRAVNERLWHEIRERKRMEQEGAEACRQIEKNIEQFATLTDRIGNPLQVIHGMADLINDPQVEKIREQVHQIKVTLKELDEGWMESTKVQEYLERYRGEEKPGSRTERFLKSFRKKEV